MQVKSEVMRRLVLGRDRGGKCKYDPQAKTELIQEWVPINQRLSKERDVLNESTHV